MKFWIVGILLITIASVGYTQHPGGGRPDFSNMPAEGVITGKIVDKDLGNAMEYANLVIYRAKDSTLVNGTVTDREGKFKLEKVPFGRYYAIGNFIGYDKTTIGDIKITPSQKVVDLGTINLKLASTNLQGVEVNADKDRVEFKIDKKVVNVSQDLMGSSGSAVAVLENIPSVNVDIEGNVSLRGSSSFTVLIDGRPSVLTGSDALQQIPASSIDRIEIITNPSAKYDPDGVGGIINVILKKQKKQGLNGVINASIGTGNKYKADFLLNYRTKNFNIFGGPDFNYNDFKMTGRNEYIYYSPDTTSYRNSDMSGVHTRKGYGIRAGMDYYLTDRSTLTLSGRYGGYGFDEEHDISRVIYTEPFISDQYSKSISNSNRNGNYYEMNLDYIVKFDDKGHQLEAMGFYSNRNGDDEEIQKDYQTDADWNLNDSVPQSIRTTEGDNSDEYRLKVDYTKPFGENGKIEAGYQSRFEIEKENYIFNNYDYGLNEWIDNSLYTSKSDYRQDIHSVYGTFSNNWGNFGYQLGLRGEYTYRRIANEKSPQIYIIDQFDVFPTLHLSEDLGAGHEIMASYGRRIDRPDGRELDPFVSYMDPYNVRIGNPDLQPEYIDSYELSYQKKLKDSFISLEGYYRIDKNKITRIRTVDDSTGIIINTFQNLTKDFSLGTELMANLNLTKWLLVNASVNVFNYKLEGYVENADVSKNSTNWDSKLNITLKMKHDIRGQISCIYSGPTVTAQGDREGYFMTNVALRKDFLDRKLSATLSVRDLFGTARRIMTTTGTNFYSYDNFKRESPIVMLNLSYIINNYKKQKMNDNNGNQDNESDMEF